MALNVKLDVATEHLPSPMPSFDPFSKDSSLPLSSWIFPLKVITVLHRKKKSYWFIAIFFHILQLLPDVFHRNLSEITSVMDSVMLHV